MQHRLLPLLLLPAAALCSVYTQYNSAWDPSLALRVAIIGDCKDVYATPRVYSDAQFLFRELPGLDGSADGVSLMPAANDGFFLCAESNATGRLVAVSPAVSASLCTFRKVAGLSNPALVSFEQRGRYVGYARGYDYLCATWFSGMMGWTVGLVDRPADATLASWVASQSSPVGVYVQDTYYWLCACNGSAVFFNTRALGEPCWWDVVPALSTGPNASAAFSLRLYNTSVFLGVGTQLLDNDSVPLALRHSCSGTESECTWTAEQSPTTGDFLLTNAASGWIAAVETTSSAPACSTPKSARAVLVRHFNKTVSMLGFWRAKYVQPPKPPVAEASSGDGCEQHETCLSCVAESPSCGWCSDTGLCLNASSSSRAACSLWFYDSCAPEKGDGPNLSFVAPLVGVVGGAIVVAAVVVVVMAVLRSLSKRNQGAANFPVQGPSANFVSVSHTENNSVEGGPTVFSGVTADSGVGVGAVASDSFQLSVDMEQFARESLAPLSLTTGPCMPVLEYTPPPPPLGELPSVQLHTDSYDIGVGGSGAQDCVTDISH
eukprot:m51a1_g10297 hypothetical protein (547) ;mRNA; r:47455-49260